MSVRAHILSRPRFESDAFAKFLDDNSTTWYRTETATDAEQIVEVAGRTCYMSFGARQSPKTNAEYIQHLIAEGHESVLEHVSWTFLLEGVSRSFTHQLVRHRVGFAFSQLSQQYHDESDALFVKPQNLSSLPVAEAAWHRATSAAVEAYREILSEIKTATASEPVSESRREAIRSMRSLARSVLPNATETKIVVTANARAIRHFLRTRGVILGDLEMRVVSVVLLNLLRPDAPALFSDFEVTIAQDGYPIVDHRSSADGGTSYES